MLTKLIQAILKIVTFIIKKNKTDLSTQTTEIEMISMASFLSVVV